MCKNKFQSPCECRNELSNPRCLAVSVISAEPCLQTTVRQLGLESYIGHTQGWLKTSHMRCQVLNPVRGVRYTTAPDTV